MTDALILVVTPQRNMSRSTSMTIRKNSLPNTPAVKAIKGTASLLYKLHRIYGCTTIAHNCFSSEFTKQWYTDNWRMLTGKWDNIRNIRHLSMSNGSFLMNALPDESEIILLWTESENSREGPWLNFLTVIKFTIVVYKNMPTDW